MTDSQPTEHPELKDATLKSRWAYNEAVRLAKQGVDGDAPTVTSDTARGHHPDGIRGVSD